MGAAADGVESDTTHDHSLGIMDGVGLDLLQQRSEPSDELGRHRGTVHARRSDAPVLEREAYSTTTRCVAWS